MRAPTKAEWIAAGKWCKDHLPTFTVSFVTFSALWLAVTLTELTLFVFDASFYRSLAPPGMELWFQSIGVCFRLVVIFGGLAIVYGKQNGMPKAAIGTLRFLFIFSFCAVMVSALGYVSEGGDFHYRKNAAIGQTETATTDSADTIIARATAEKEAIRKDRDQLVAAARQSMNLVLDDGRANNDDVSGYEANIAKYQTDAEAKLAAQDAIIAKAEGERLTAKKVASSQGVGDPALATVFRFPARYVQGWDGITFRDAFSLFWVILLEAIGAFGAQALLTIQMSMSRKKRFSDMGKEGGKTTARRKRQSDKLLRIKHYEDQKTATTADLTEEVEPLEDDDLTEDADDDDQDEPETPKQAAE